MVAPPGLCTKGHGMQEGAYMCSIQVTLVTAVSQSSVHGHPAASVRCSVPTGSFSFGCCDLV